MIANTVEVDGDFLAGDAILIDKHKGEDFSYIPFCEITSVLIEHEAGGVMNDETVQKKGLNEETKRWISVSDLVKFINWCENYKKWDENERKIMNSKEIEYLKKVGFTFETLADKLKQSWEDILTLQKILRVISEDDCYCICSDRLSLSNADAGYVVPYKMCMRPSIDSIKTLNINLRDKSKEDYLEGCSYVEEGE